MGSQEIRLGYAVCIDVAQDWYRWALMNAGMNIMVL